MKSVLFLVYIMYLFSEEKEFDLFLYTYYLGLIFSSSHSETLLFL